MQRRKLDWVVFVVVSVLVLGTFAYGVIDTRWSRSAAAVRAYGVDEFLASASANDDEPVRVSGEIVPGSLVRRVAPCEYRFMLQKNGFEMPVRYGHCAVPDSLEQAAEGARSTTRSVPVDVEGVLEPSGFVASAVRVRVPSCFPAL